MPSEVFQKLAPEPDPDTLPEWLKPSVAARLLGCAQSTINYRVGIRLYRSRRPHGRLVVSRDDVLKHREELEKKKAAATRAA